MPTEEVLHAAAARLVAAKDSYAANPTPAAADRVIAARLAVKEAFIAAGWEPPESTLKSMQRDRLLLREHAGTLEGQSKGSESSHRAERRRSRVFTLPGGSRLVVPFGSRLLNT